MRPVIGITAYEEDARWGPWDERAVLVPAAYVHAVERAGGAAMVLPVQSTGVEELLARVDGVVLSGGPDVDPAHYGEERHPETQSPRAERDEFELRVALLVLERAVPTLGVCRGMQVLNVARGGTLHQHLPDLVGHRGHSPVAGEFAWHRVTVDPDSRLAAALGRHEIETASHHHQAVATLGRGLRIVARADDNTAEAFEDPSAPYLFGVQWHPEAGTDFTLFEALIDRSRP
ncbi:MAG TPA: gamma-glutamyl-gamma-aminobutyrate hydrolase family protein [Acidimicrobiales bacterium]|nr:gamma-glutamyl-gamma-aminobutyrate hydrolase family protein [Acidimicrobiales bacterium]